MAIYDRQIEGEPRQVSGIRTITTNTPTRRKSALVVYTLVVAGNCATYKVFWLAPSLLRALSRSYNIFQEHATLGSVRGFGRDAERW